MDTDKIILRHAYLQSYAKGYTEKLIKAHKAGDTALIKFLREWYDEASEKDIYDALRGNHKNANAKLLSETIASILKEQTATTLDMVLLEMTELAESEVNATIAAMEMKPVSISTPTVMALPILGESVKDGWINNRDRANKLVKTRIVDALQNGQEPHKALRGSKDQNYKDGAFYTRNLSVQRLGPTQVNGVSSNGIGEIHKAYQITKEDFLATLDHRTCPQCGAAESNGPYKVGSGPIPPLHFFCRCIRIASGLDETRPYVNDARRVKDIPKSERAGKIGQTKKSYEEWFDGQTETAKKDILGAGRYELYKNGDVKIKEFTSDGGSLYTVAQLDEKYSAAK